MIFLPLFEINFETLVTRKGRKCFFENPFAFYLIMIHEIFSENYKTTEFWIKTVNTKLFCGSQNFVSFRHLNLSKLDPSGFYYVWLLLPLFWLHDQDQESKNELKSIPAAAYNRKSLFRTTWHTADSSIICDVVETQSNNFVM